MRNQDKNNDVSWRGQSGIILPIVLVFLALGLLILTPALGLGSSTLAGSVVTADKARELQAADAGVELGLYWLTTGGMHNCPVCSLDDSEEFWEIDRFSINECHVDVIIKRRFDVTQGSYVIESTAYPIGGDAGTLVRAFVTAQGGGYTEITDDSISGPIEGSIVFEGGLEIKDGDVDGDVVGDGKLEIKEGSVITGSVSVTLESSGSGPGREELQIKGESQILGNLCIYVRSDSTFNKLLVGEESTIHGGIYIFLDPGARFKIEVEGNSSIGDVFIRSDHTATVSAIESKPGTTIGDLYIVSSVTVLETEINGSKGSINRNWDPSENPVPFTCPYPTSGDGGFSVDFYEVS